MTPLTPADLAALAKTGCTRCHGRGRHVYVKPPRSVLCRCVARRIAGRPEYAVDRGIVCRVTPSTVTP